MTFVLSPLLAHIESVDPEQIRDHFTADQFEPILLRKFGTKKLKRDAAPTIFSQEHLQTLGKPIALKNWKMFSPSSLGVLQIHSILLRSMVFSTLQALKALSLGLWHAFLLLKNCNAPVRIVNASSSVDACLPKCDVTEMMVFFNLSLSFLGHTATDSALSDFPEDAPSSCECDALPACSTACSAGSSSSSWDADQAVVAALHKSIATLKECLNDMKRKVATLQQQKSRANRRNHELARNIKKYLSPDQLQGMWTSSMRGKQWSTETLQKGLKLRLACGSRGYNAITTMKEHGRHEVLILDEIQLSSGLAFDQTTGTVIGTPTLPLADGSLPHAAVATHGLVFMLGGVTQRWKQTVAYHLTGNSFSSAAVQEQLIEIIQECETIGVRIDAVVSDMGGGNMALWREFGIVVGKHSVSRVSCCHPVDQNRKLYFMEDTAHLLKNLRNHLTRGQSIFLPENVVEKHKLS
ncbi:hypothetical protein HPB51_023810 [Rhipicephalus microplus]|uniref:Transposable element P transposase-like RNase H domain-containing protein n=1 Tax=Rhipicephalus microplus TaxID=6941 RepID=A0A9J6DJK2_RHIMP|nr:hypothetical protein HPB51_023810 [Rhipicephalus microplus]